MFSRKEIAEERKQNARKKQAYRQIGIISNRSSKKKSLNFIETKQLVLNSSYKAANSKNILFSLGDGTTTFTRVSEFMALKMQKKLRILDLAILILTIINFVIWTSENELFYYNGHIFTTKINILRGIYLVITVPIVGLTYQRSKIYVERQKHRGELRADLSFYEWDIISFVILELVYNCILPIPGFDIMLNIQQRGKTYKVSVEIVVILS